MTDLVYGFVGLGDMGHPMAANLARAKLPVVAFDAAGTDERLPPGAMPGLSVTEVAARTDAIFLSLPDGEAVLSVVGQIAGSEDRRADTVIDLSTIGVEAAEEAARRCEDAGLGFADCPVSGGQAGARAATISTMWAGPAEILDVHRPALAAISANIFHVSTAPGHGQAVKLLNNFLSATAMAATSEAVHFGMAHGLDMRTILEVVNVSSGRSYGSLEKFPRHVLTGSFDSRFRLGLMAKDLALYRKSVEAAGTAARIGHLMADLWQEGAEQLPDADHTEIFKYLTGAT